jgi:hypothetical protein
MSVLDGLEVLLAGALDEAEVVCELAHLLGAGVGVGVLEDVAEEAVPGLACTLEVLRVDRRGELGVVARELLAREQLVEHPVEVLRDGALLRARSLVELGAERIERRADLLRGCAHGLDLARREPPVVAGRGLADKLAEPLGILARDRLREVGEDPAGQRPRVLE